MKLTDEQRKSLKQKLDQWFGKERDDGKMGVKCIVCEENRKWNISEVAFELREFNNGDFTFGDVSAVQPVLPLICGTCGYTIFLNLMKLFPEWINQPASDDTNEKGGQNG